MRTVRAVGAALLVATVVGCSGDAAPDPTPEAPATSISATPTASASPALPTSGRPTATGLPTVVAAIGDSITIAVNPDRQTFGSDPRRSWATGEDPADEVGSHVERLRTAGAPITTVTNLAVAGAQVSDGPGQAAQAAAAGADYVTVALGANDACRGDAITSVDEFRRLAAETLQTVAGSGARILVVSVPDVSRLWSVARGQENARAVWDEFEICRGVLPTGSTDESRAAVRARVRAYNEIWRRTCAATPLCRYDGGAVFDRAFTLAEVSPLDFFHPSVRGQAQLAEVTWRAGWWPDR